MPSFRLSTDLMNVDAFGSKFTMADCPILLAGHSLVLHGWRLLLLLLRLLSCWLLQVLH